MKKLYLIFILLLCGCSNSQNEEIKFDIDLPEGYQIEESQDKYMLLSANKFVDGQIIGVIEIKYSDDRAFLDFDNDEYIEYMIEEEVLESTSSLLLDDFEIIKIDKESFLGVGDALAAIFSGTSKSNQINSVSFTIQFVKNKKLFTLSGNSLPEYFSSELKDYYKSFDTFKLINSNSDLTLDQRFSNIDDDRKERGELIDRIISELKDAYSLPMKLGEGIVWVDVINERDRYFVYKYEVEPNTNAVNYVTKTSIVSDMKAANGFDFAKPSGIIMVWRYFTGNQMIKEIIVEPFEM